MLPDQEAASEWQFAGGSCKGLAGDCFRAAGKLDDHVAGLDDGNPFFRRAFSLTHTGFERLLAVGLVGEHPNPNLSAALHVAGGRDTCRFDLTGGQPAAIKYLKTKFTKVQLIAAARDPCAGTSLNLSVICAFWHQRHF